MARIFYLITIATAVFSCCLISSQDCNCDPPEPFVNENAISWISPFSSGNYLMQNIENNVITQQTLERDYEESKECLGGDECCTSFVVHIAGFAVIGASLTSQNLIYTKAVQDYVFFYVGDDNTVPKVQLGRYDVKTNTLTPMLLGTELQLSDTIIGGSRKSRIQFIHKENHPKILFKTLTLVKDIGVTDYVDNANRSWLKK
jgi:hypothetical protein